MEPLLILTGFSGETRVVREVGDSWSSQGAVILGRIEDRPVAILEVKNGGEKVSALLNRLVFPQILLVGVCTGLVPQLKVGDLFIPDQVKDVENSFFIPEASKIQKLFSASEFHKGTLYCSSFLPKSPLEKQKLALQTNAVAQDSDASVLRGVGRRVGIVKIVSETDELHSPDIREPVLTDREEAAGVQDAAWGLHLALMSLRDVVPTLVREWS